MFVDLEREDLRRAAGAGDCNGEQSDRPAAGDGDALGSNLAGKHRVYRIAQRIENAGVLLWNRRIELPDVRFGDDDVLGERAVRVDADDLHVLADVGFPDAALQTLAAG